MTFGLSHTNILVISRFFFSPVTAQVEFRWNKIWKYCSLVHYVVSEPLVYFDLLKMAVSIRFPQILTKQRVMFPFKGFFNKDDERTNIKELCIVSWNKYRLLQLTDLVTFTGEILNGKLHFLCSVST